MEHLNITTQTNPNSRARLGGPDGIIIHAMSEVIAGVPAAKFLEKIGLSAHYLIAQDGSITECVHPGRVAYHAGISAWQGRTNLNMSTIGIELLVAGDNDYDGFLAAIDRPDTFTSEQYRACAKLCLALIANFPAISCERILRHSTVSGPDVRPDPKPDPGDGWDMIRLFETMEDLES